MSSVLQDPVHDAENLWDYQGHCQRGIHLQTVVTALQALALIASIT